MVNSEMTMPGNTTRWASKYRVKHCTNAVEKRDGMMSFRYLQQHATSHVKKTQQNLHHAISPHSIDLHVMHYSKAVVNSQHIAQPPHTS
jgi:hypothetical protein